jgi:hypothetical protein
MHLDRGAVQQHGLDLEAQDLGLPQTREYPIQPPAFDQRLSRVERMCAIVFGQAPPFAALFDDIQEGVENLEVRQADVAALPRQAALYQAVLRFGPFHTPGMSQSIIGVNRP